MKNLILKTLACFVFLIGRAETNLSEIYQDPHAQAYYKEKSGFFKLSSPDALPKNLKWISDPQEPIFASTQAKRGGVLNYFINGTPPVLRRVGPNSNNSFRGIAYDGNDFSLITLHPNSLKPIPCLAASWAISEDGLTAYFKLNPRVKFTDGQPVSADDYLYTFYFYQSPWINEAWYNDFYTKEFAGITKYDDYTIAIHLPSKKPDPLYILGSIHPTPRQFYKNFGPDYCKVYGDRFEPTTGAYTIPDEDFVRGQRVTLRRIPHWWGDDERYTAHRYNVDAIEFKVIREMDKAHQIFLQGECDLFFMGTPKFWYGANLTEPYQAGFIQKARFFNDTPRPPFGLYINTLKPLLSDLNIRIGLQHATDFQRVIDTFYRGDYERLNQFSQGYGEFTNPNIKARKFNPALAKAAFARAGFTEVGSDGILRKPDGTRLSIRLTMDDSERRKFLPTLIESAKLCGLEYRPEVLEHTTMYRKVMEKNHELCFWAWGATGLQPELWQSHHGDNAVEKTVDGLTVAKRQTNNITGTHIPELSDIIDRFRASTDKSEMIQLSFKAQQLIHDEASFIPAFCVPSYRLAYWNWLKWPTHFDVRTSDDPLSTGLFWIEPNEKSRIQTILKRPQWFQSLTPADKLPPTTHIFDQWRTE